MFLGTGSSEGGREEGRHLEKQRERVMAIQRERVMAPTINVCTPREGSRSPVPQSVTCTPWRNALVRSSAAKGGEGGQRKKSKEVLLSSFLAQHLTLALAAPRRHIELAIEQAGRQRRAGGGASEGNKRDRSPLATHYYLPHPPPPAPPSSASARARPVAPRPAAVRTAMLLRRSR